MVNVTMKAGKLKYELTHSVNVRGTAMQPSDDRQSHREKIARITLDAIAHFVGLLDKSGTVLDINRGAMDAAGVTLAEVEGQPFWNTNWWQVSEKVNADLRGAIARASLGEHVRWETEIYEKVGSQQTVTIDASLMPVLDDNGQVVFLCVEARNINERKAHEREIARHRQALDEHDGVKSGFSPHIVEELHKQHTQVLRPLEVALADAETELRDIRSRMEAALEEAAIGTWSWNISEDRFFADASLARIFSLPPELTDGSSLSRIVDYIHPDDRERVAQLVGEAVASGHYYEADYRVKRPNGTWRWITARGHVERDAQGRAVRFPGVVIDITERKHAEEELERVTAESERRKRLYETILSATPDFVYVFSLDYHVLYANDSLISMWGIGDPVGKSFLEIGYEPWHAEMHNREIDTVRSTKMPIRGEVPFSGTNGRKIYDYIFVPVFGLDGEVEAVAGTTRDITDRKAMEEELRDTDRRKDDFIALLAHELRNPLAPIRNGLQVLRLSEGNPDAITETRAMMDRQLSHMVRLIDDLLDVSRINRNKMELRRSRVTLADVIASAVETAQPQIDEAKHELTITLPAVPIFLDADLTRLAQVFSNLLTNSAKYTQPGGRILMSARRTGAEVEVSVSDNGIGIPENSLTNIFDMFSQVDRAIERNTGGLGIGLSLVRGLVEMHGGSVMAISDGEGKGSTFTVTLPVLPGNAVAAKLDVAPGSPAFESRRILVVDDNRDGADSLAMMLRLMGHEMLTANDGLEAIELAEQFRPDVVLMDVGMPILDGLEATRRIRSHSWSQNMIIIALTGWGQEGDREKSREAGCDGHLVKPVELRDLEKLLTDVNSIPRASSPSLAPYCP